MSVKISKTNSKLGVIPSINLTPIATCRDNCPCSGDCYALKGRFRFQNVKDNMAANYAAYRENPDTYFADIKREIDNGMVVYSYFRWHSAGDIVDMRYLQGMVDIANSLDRTSFLAFTKKYELVNEYIASGGVIPNNLHIVFSAWGNSLFVDNPNGFPVAYVRFGDSERDSDIPVNASECSGKCTTCLQCWNLGRGEAVVFNKH